MWLWVLLGWLGLSGLVVAVRYRSCRASSTLAPDHLAFLERFEAILAENHPDVRYGGLLLDQFACLLVVEGQETPVALSEASRHEAAFPDAFPEYVARLVDEIRAVGLDRIEDVDLAFAAPDLLPQVRSTEWLRQAGCFGDSGLVHRRINDDLVVVYVVDDPSSMVFVCRAHLRRWRKSEGDIHNLALANLAKLDSVSLDQLHATPGPLRLDVGDGYDSARLLLLDDVDGLLVSVPDRDVLWVSAEQRTDLGALIADTRQIAQLSPHPVSPKVFRVSAGQFEALPGEARS